MAEMLRGYELLGEWKNSNCGKTVKGTKDGKIFFIKRYQTPVMPLNNGALDERTFNQNKAYFEDFVSRRTRVNQMARSVAGEGGNIVIPAEEFIDGNNYMEAAEFVDGVVPDDELETVLASLSMDVKKLLMLTAAGALATIHALRIIHSDLKLENVLLARNASSGNYVAKVIDFDSAYFVDNVPDEVTGDIRYFSPELATYSDEEEDKESLKSTLTTKSDIFSLGIIFHRYLTGEFPEGKNLTERLQKRKDSGKPVYCWNILLNGCELQVSSSIPEGYRNLIIDMLDKDPAKRPTATEVLRRLKFPTAGARTSTGSTTSSSTGATRTVTVVEEPWPEHGMMIDKAKVVADGYVTLKKKDVGGRHVYELTDASGRKQDLTDEELIAKSYAEKLTVGFCETWPEHKISWNEAKLSARGFISAKRKEQAGVKGYDLFRGDSTGTFFTKEKLTMMGYAIKEGGSTGGASVSVSTSSSTATATATTTTTERVTTFCAPWSDHNIEFNMDIITAKGYCGAKQEARGAIKGYLFFYTAGGNRFLTVETLCMLKLAKRI